VSEAAGGGAELSASARRVDDLLRAMGHPGGVIQFSGTARTAVEAAAAIGCSVGEIAKSLVFRTAGGRPVLVVASGPNRVDEKKVAAAIGEAIGKADADFVRNATGYAIGGVAPIGHLTPPIVLIDADLERYNRIWAAAGHPHAVFALTFPHLVQLTGGTVLAIK
jgi:prolyl-tRNA editing enzyme YbaK/EbsC (Cys-tRNA(Pro) deacylase)